VQYSDGVAGALVTVAVVGDEAAVALVMIEVEVKKVVGLVYVADAL